MKLLVDECLSEELTKLAQRRGHAEASHVAWIGKRGWKDWELKSLIIDGDWTFVTRNSIDFRGPRDAPGSQGQYADVAVHANDDLVNEVLEISLSDSSEEFEVLRYKMPAENA